MAVDKCLRAVDNRVCDGSAGGNRCRAAPILLSDFHEPPRYSRAGCTGAKIACRSNWVDKTRPLRIFTSRNARDGRTPRCAEIRVDRSERFLIRLRYSSSAILFSVAFKEHHCLSIQDPRSILYSIISRTRLKVASSN